VTERVAHLLFGPHMGHGFAARSVINYKRLRHYEAISVTTGTWLLDLVKVVDGLVLDRY